VLVEAKDEFESACRHGIITSQLEIGLAFQLFSMQIRNEIWIYPSKIRRFGRPNPLDYLHGWITIPHRATRSLQPFLSILPAFFFLRSDSPGIVLSLVAEITRA